MICKHCDTELKSKKYKYFELFYCDNCWRNIIFEDYECCENQQLEFVKYIIDGGGFHLRKICSLCSKVFSKSYKHSECDNLDELKEVTIETMNKRSLKISEIRKKLTDNYWQKSNEILSNRAFDEMDEYYNSEKWKEKRLLVLKRDNYICQACLVLKATEVHHLTYKYFKNEPLFTLISLCTDCHKLITKIDREKND